MFQKFQNNKKIYQLRSGMVLQRVGCQVRLGLFGPALFLSMANLTTLSDKFRFLEILQISER